MYNSYNIIADMAVSSLLEEAETTPKPGLVDRRNSGAHSDMDYPLFVQSSNSLRAYFAECAKLGSMGLSMKDLAQNLRKAGIAAEKKMFEATRGVNTQKGLVFSMGIVCAGFSSLVAEKSQIDDSSLKERFALISSSLLENEKTADSNGLRALTSTGIGGIRKEALSGFETCFEQGIGTLRKSFEKGRTSNGAAVEALLALISFCEDSNVVHRGGTEALHFVRERAKEILSRDYEEGTLLKKTSQFDDECIEKNISPGGAADLLALTLMIHKITTQKERLL